MESLGCHGAHMTAVLGELAELSAVLDRVEEQVVARRELPEDALADLDRAAEALSDIAARGLLRFEEILEVLRAASRVEYIWGLVEHVRISTGLRQAQDRLKDAVGADAWPLYLEIEEIHNSRSHGHLQAWWRGCLPPCLAIAQLLAGAPTATKRAYADRGSASQERQG